MSKTQTTKTPGKPRFYYVESTPVPYFGTMYAFRIIYNLEEGAKILFGPPPQCWAVHSQYPEVVLNDYVKNIKDLVLVFRNSVRSLDPKAKFRAGTLL